MTGLRPLGKPVSRRPLSGGFSLIELLVSMAIGLVVTIAIASVMVSAENDKRSSTSVNDINQSGSYAAYILDRQIRSAGSGFAASWTTMVGCAISAQNVANSTAVMPRPAFSNASPFYNWTNNGLAFRLAPVVIAKGQANIAATDHRGDILMVMAGTGGANETPVQLLAGISSSGMRVYNTIGFRAGDLVLVADPNAVAGQCMVQQIGTPTTGVLPFDSGTTNNYAQATIGTLSVTSFAPTTSGVAAQIGNNNANLPQFSLLAVGPNNTLYANDLLPAGALNDTGVPIADSVVEMRALYGTTVDWTAPSAPVWVDPGTSPYTAAELLNGTATSRTNLHRIVAIKLGLVLATPIGETKPVVAAAPTLFAGVTNTTTGVDLSYTPSYVAAGPPYYRYRTIETTIALRNVLGAP